MNCAICGKPIKPEHCVKITIRGSGHEVYYHERCINRPSWPGPKEPSK